MAIPQFNDDRYFMDDLAASGYGPVWAALMVGPCDDESRKSCFSFFFKKWGEIVSQLSRR